MAAAKGNKYAIGNNGGRPRVFSSAKSLLKEVNGYFEYIKGELCQFDSSEDNDEEAFPQSMYKRLPEPATITGLALYLGFQSRQSMYDYVKTEEFSYIVKAAISRVEHEYEKGLRQDKSAVGSIFALKNMGWQDKIQQEVTGKDGLPIQTENRNQHDFSQLTAEQVEALLEKGGR